MKDYESFDSIAIVGATGAVGTIICRLLGRAEVSLQADQVSGLGPIGRQEDSLCRPRSHRRGADARRHSTASNLAIGSTPDEVARDFAPWAVERGCLVVDESGYWRMDPKVPLVVPEVNPHAVARASRDHRQPELFDHADGRGHEAAARRRAESAAWWSAPIRPPAAWAWPAARSWTPRTRAAVAGEDYKPAAFAHPIAFNLIPQIGSHKEQGYTSEEMKMVYETRKIIGDDSIQVCPTCVRVPVTNCHSESILVETERKLTVAEARKLFAATPGIIVVDDLASKSYPMPSTCDGRDEVFIGRIREDLSSPNGLAFWCVSDNLRKGAATNAVQIAELLVARSAQARGRGEPAKTWV